ncbi:DUF6236 family protein [Streptomyces phaeochromogenes]|uniref:DUF6236 family protein n=1 Tax=Streptomyces phaeochromogenes TaxID=1923 RepID=A0ABZ1HQV4_STRPH|nr:DUF6236 family protein [Streptomyces phaeochromogenes]WSD20983.1 DUF6236 family protein [Streptomyces phaeochromogenes]
MAPRIGLYFPYVHIRDAAWVKATALYWPALARVAAVEYPVHDSDTVRALADGLDFIQQLPPGPAAEAVAPHFINVIREHHAILHPYFGVSPEDIDQSDPSDPEWRAVNRYSPPGEIWRPPDERTSLVEVHWDEFAPALRQVLLDSQLGLNTHRPTLLSGDEEYDWMSVDPKLAWVYKLALTEELARQHGLTPITDNPVSQQQVHDWDEARIFAELFDYHPHDPSPVSAIGMLTTQLPLPEGIADVPVDDIIKLRTDYQPEFDRFVDALDAAAAELTSSLLEEQDPQIVALHVAHIRRTHFEQPLNDLKAAIKGLKLGTGLGLMNLQTQLPALGAIGGAAAQWPAITATSIGFGLVGLHHVAAKERDRIRSDSPVTYLLQAEKVADPPSFINRWTIAGSRGLGINI